MMDCEKKLKDLESKMLESNTSGNFNPKESCSDSQATVSTTQLVDRITACENELKLFTSLILDSSNHEEKTIADMESNVQAFKTQLQETDRMIKAIQSQRTQKPPANREQLYHSDTHDTKNELPEVTTVRPQASEEPNEETSGAVGDSGDVLPDQPLPNSVMFSVGLSTSRLTRGSPTPLSDLKCVFHPSTHVTERGAFLVPRDGSYELTVSVWQGDEGKLEAGLAWGGNHWWWHLGKTNSATDVMSTSYIRRFKKDDKIRVYVIQVEGRAVVSWCIFSGKFIHS